MCCLHTSSPICTSVGIRVTYVALQVGLQLAQALMKGSRSESTSDVNTCSVATSVFVHSKTPLCRWVQASVFWNYTTLHSSALCVGTSCCHSVHFNCFPFKRRSIGPAVARSFSHHLNCHKDHVQALHRASHHRPILVVRSASSEVHTCKATHRRLHCRVASVPVQHQRNKERRMDSGLQPKQGHCQVGHQR